MLGICSAHAVTLPASAAGITSTRSSNAVGPTPNLAASCRKPGRLRQYRRTAVMSLGPNARFTMSQRTLYASH